MAKFSSLDQDDQKKVGSLPASLQSRIQKRLSEKKLFPNPGNERLSIGGRISDYDPGDRTARWLVGFGAGEGAIVAQVSFSDSSGNVFASGTATGKVQWGFAGGSIDSAITELAEAIVSFIEKSMGMAAEGRQR